MQVGTDTDWSLASRSQYGLHAAAIKRDGTLWGLGDNVGDGTTILHSLPVRISTDTNWTAASSGSISCARRRDNSLWCWGTTPADIQPGTTWTAFASGPTASAAIRPEGTLWFTDLPLNGMLLVALAAWVLRFGPAEQHADAVHLLAVARRWAYNRSIPVMAWDPMVALADAADPGRLGPLVAELGGRPGPDLVPGAAAALDRLQRAWHVTSAG